MKKIVFTTFALIIAATFAVAQNDGSTMNQPEKVTPLELPWERQNVGEFSEPVPYVFIRGEVDVTYYVTIWRTIDLREKRNHPLYFPITKRGTWRSLAQVILDAIDFQNPDNENPLPVYDTEFCERIMTPEEVRSALAERKTKTIFDMETQEAIGSQEIEEEFGAGEILYYNVKEVWFFDKQRSLLEVRILEIQPLLELVKELNTGEFPSMEDDENSVGNEPVKRSIGYIKYDELRPYLVKQEMFNIKNNAARLTLDDVLTWKRFFASFIIAKQNAYEDRQIQDYIKNSRDQRLESEKITEEIRKIEHDFWQF